MARVSPPTRRSLLKGMIAYRWLTIAWAAGVFTWEVVWRRESDAVADVAHPLVGFALAAAAVLFTGALTVQFNRDPDVLLRPSFVLAEIALATTMLLADTWVFGSSDHPQTLPSVWVVGAVGAVAIAGGRRAAVVAGAGMGFARYVGLAPLTGIRESLFRGLSTTVLLAVSGWVMGYLLERLAETDRFISAFRAREEVARTLHDGVLQTLAVIQRRSTDHELVDLARSQEHELRDYLFGATSVDADLASGLRAAARRAEERFGLRVQVVAAPDLPDGSDDVIQRLSAAVGEALTNAAKHGEAATVTVYAEPGDDGSVFVSVKDDGVGFDHHAVAEGEGLSRSIRGRLVEAGGRVEVDGRPGRGTEVRMWL